MTPSVPRGSSPRASLADSEPTRADSGAPAASDRPTVAPLRLSLESSYLLAGEAGFPLRGGVIATYRPDRLLGIGLHLDSNFTDHLSVTARAEAIVPIHRHFHLEGALEVGARAFFGQTISTEGIEQSVNGALFTFGGEIAASVPFSDVIGASLFLRAFWSPAGGLSTMGADNDGPSRGVQVEGGEILLGLRLDFYPPVAPHYREPEPEIEAEPAASSEPIATPPTQREALQGLQETVDALLEESPATDTPTSPSTATAPEPEAVATPTATDAATGAAPSEPLPPSADTETSTPVSTFTPEDREEVLALQREIRSLAESSSALETELDAATHILDELSAGQEAGQSHHIVLDSLYDGLSSRPPRLDLAVLNEFTEAFGDLIRNDGSVRLLIQSPSESFGGGILGNLRVFRSTLARYQRHFPVRSRDGGPTRADLEPALSRLGVIIEEITQLREHPESTQPPAHQLRLWRLRMERIRGHIAELAPRLSPAQQERLEIHVERVEDSFAELSQTMEEAERNWQVTRALYSHYTDFRAARRPEQISEALRGMLREIENAPESYRRVRSRNLTTLTNLLTPFVQSHSVAPTPAWNESRDLAIRVLRWVDSSYEPPAIEAARRRRAPRARSEETIFEFPAAGGGGE